MSRLDGPGEREIAFDGSVLVADIAGYARLIEEHTAIEHGGIEQLTHVLRGAFDAILRTIESYGGEVVYLAGDAVVAYWQGQDAISAAAMAVACARDLLDRRRSAPPRDLPPLHLGVASGSLWAAKVGGWSGRYSLLFGGAGTRRAFAALRRASRGQVFVSRETRELLQPGAPARPQTLEETDPSPNQGIPIFDPRDFLPSGVEVRADTDDGSWTAELRPVECLFLRLPDIDESRPGALPAFRRALLIVHDTLGTASATGRLVIDEQGLTIVWVGGEPLAHVRHEAPGTSLTRAARAFDRLRAQGFRPSGGLAAGRALCGLVGSIQRREPVVVGAPMVLAARLMEQQQPRLLVAGIPAHHLGPDLVSSPVPPQRLKGFDQEIEAMAVGPAANRGSGRIVAHGVVGRGDEQAQLERQLDALLEGRGGLCVIRGPAGIGKSALLRTLPAAASARGIAWSLGEAFGAERRVAYFAWRPIFRACFSDLAFDAPERLRKQLRTALGRAGQNVALAPLLDVVFPTSFGENDDTSRIVGAGRARATRDLLLALLARQAPSPLLIAIEDLHHMDSASLELLELAVQRLQRVRFVATARPTSDDNAFLSRVDALADERIDVGPIGADDVVRMAGDHLGQRLGPAVAAEIALRAHGIPLYVRAYLDKLRELAAGPEAPATWDEMPDNLADFPDLASAPDPLRAVLAKSFDGLPRLANRALRVASVIGERFSDTVLEDVVAQTGNDEPLAEALATLEARGLIRALDDARGHQFTHALLQTTCAETIPADHRRELHVRIAAVLERPLGAGHLEASDAEIVDLAHHHGKAGNHARAIHFADEGARRAKRHGAYREEIRLLGQCLEAADRLPGDDALTGARVRWRRLKSQASGAIGDRQGRTVEAEAALALAGLPLPRGRARQLFAAAPQLLRRAFTRPLVPPADAGAEPADPAARALDEDVSQAYRQLAIAGYFGGDPVRIALGTTRGLSHALRLGRSPELCEALASFGMFLGLTGFVKAGARYLGAACTLALEIGREPALIFADVSSALFLLGQGEWGMVRMHTDRCQAQSRRIGDTENWGYAQALRFWMKHYTGETEEAEAVARELATAAEAANNLQHRSWAARFVALCQMRRGEWAAAHDSLQSARNLFREAASRRELRPLYELMPVLADLGRVKFALESKAEGRTLCAEALRELDRARRPAGHAVIEGCSSLAAVAFTIAARGDDDGELPLRRTLRLLARCARAFPIARPRLALWQGRAAQLAGHPRRALAAWRAGLALAEQMGMRHEAVLLAAAIAEGAPRLGPVYVRAV